MIVQPTLLIPGYTNFYIVCNIGVIGIKKRIRFNVHITYLHFVYVYILAKLLRKTSKRYTTSVHLSY